MRKHLKSIIYYSGCVMRKKLKYYLLLRLLDEEASEIVFITKVA